MGFLLHHYSRRESLVIMQGIEGRYLWDFTNLPFSECLIPILKAIELVIGWKKPEWKSDMLFMAVQSNATPILTFSGLLPVGAHLVHQLEE